MEEASPAYWDEDGVLRSRATGDVYYSKEGGLAETRAVFLEGCGLPGAWRDRRRFTVGEIGFGTGLNIAALLALWAAHRPVGGVLNIFSIEQAPLAYADVPRALAPWREIRDAAEALQLAWPGRAHGLHRMEIPWFHAILDVYVGEAAEALEGWSGRADAWFLDGFSPALNPDAWRPEVLALVAARSAPGARAATFTSAGQVRRGLADAGFAVTREPGFGGKRHRLEAVFPGEAAERPGPRRCAVIGAGIAGAALARSLRTLGAEVAVFDAEGPGAGASGNPAALVTPRLDAGLGPAARLSARCFERAGLLYADTITAAIVAWGGAQLEAGPRDARRFATIAASDLFEPGSLRPLSAADLHGRLGEPVGPGLWLDRALSVDPAMILDAWGGAVRRARIAGLRGGEDGWRLLDEEGGVIAAADAVFLAAGLGSAALLPGLPLEPVRGQMSFAPGVRLAHGVGWGGYAAPGRDGMAFGATYDRGDVDIEVRAESNARNLETLAKGLPALAARLAQTPLGARASIRAATPDRQPIAGAAPGAAGLFLLTGLGSRGFSFAPLLADHVAALAIGTPSPLPADLAAVVDPARYLGGNTPERALSSGVFAAGGAGVD